MKLAPIALFAYARPKHTAATLAALAKNELARDSVLYVFCDGPKSATVHEKLEQTRRIVQEASGFKDIIVEKSDQNRGLANSIIRGVTSLLEKEGQVIVMEDDLVSAPGFLNFMNDGLERYRNEPRVFTVCGYSHPPSLVQIRKDYAYDAFFSYRNMSWGWATWKDRWTHADWQLVDFESFRADPQARAQFNRGGPDMTQMLIDQVDGKLDSWAIRWSYAHFKHNALALLPVHSFIHNIGADSSGTHFKSTSDKFDVDLSLAKPVLRWPENPVIDPRIAKSFAGAYRRSWKRAIKKAMGMLRGTP